MSGPAPHAKGLNGQAKQPPPVVDALADEEMLPPDWTPLMAELWDKLTTLQRELFHGEAWQAPTAPIEPVRSLVEFCRQCRRHYGVTIEDLLSVQFPDGFGGGTHGQFHADWAREIWEFRDKDEAERKEAREEAEREEARNVLPSTPFAAIEAVLATNDFVEGLLCTASFVVVYGEPGSGKSFWVLDVCLHIASERIWNDRAVDRGLVIYAALEGGAGIRNRIVAARIRLGLPSDTALELIQLPLDLRSPDGDVAKFIATINNLQRRYNLPLRAVVIDTLSRAMAGGNENSPEDMGALVMNSDRVRSETGACIIYIHHCGKDAARGARGHSLLKAAADTEIEITRHENRVSVARVAKQREIEDDASFAFKLEPVTLGANHRGKPVTSCVVLPTEMPEATDGGGGQRGRPTGRSGGKTTYAWKLRGILADLILDAGRKGLRGVPPNLDAVTRDSVRDAFFDRTTADPDDRSAFTRALNALEQSGVIAVAKGHIWLTGKGSDATK